MEEALKRNLGDRNVWVRLLYMVLFAIAYAVAELVVTLVVVFQFLCVLFTGSANEPVLRFGRNLSAYIRELLEFQTFNSEVRPFPFSEWPDLAADDDNTWLAEVVDDDFDDRGDPDDPDERDRGATPHEPPPSAPGAPRDPDR